MNNLNSYLSELEKNITDAYDSSPTLEEAEKLAAKFLAAQIKVGEELQVVDLDCRMRKTGLKAIKAAVYLKEASKGDKKPSDVMLGAIVDTDKIVGEAQDGFDSAEVFKNKLENYLNVFRDAHIYFRGIAKGRFE